MVYIVSTTYMVYFSRNNKRGRGKFGKKSFGGRDSRPKMHDAICNKCGKQCQVPFRPTGERPVFCNNCFEKERDSIPQRNEGRDFDHRDRGRFHSEERHKYLATCDNCGKKCQVPFMPTKGRPTYCKECFDSGATMGERKNADSHNNTSNDTKHADSYKVHFEALNAKLDKILHMLVSNSAVQPVEKKPAKKAVASKKGKKK